MIGPPDGFGGVCYYRFEVIAPGVEPGFSRVECVRGGESPTRWALTRLHESDALVRWEELGDARTVEIVHRDGVLRLRGARPVGRCRFFLGGFWRSLWDLVRGCPVRFLETLTVEVASVEVIR